MQRYLESLGLWFEDYAKPLLDDYTPGEAGGVASEVARLRTLSETPEEVVVCLLGIVGDCAQPVGEVRDRGVPNEA